MGKQDTNIVKAFLKKASELEIALHKYNRTIEYLEEQASWYGREFPEVGKYEYGEWLKRRYEFPGNKGESFNDARPPYKSRSMLDIILSAAIESLVPSVVIAVILGIIYAESSSDVSYVVTKMIVSGVAIFALIIFLKSMTDISKQEDEYKSSKEFYESQLEKRNKLLEKEKASYAVCRFNINELIPVRDRIERQLKQHYEQDIVAEKYRNIIAVTQMYEYFELERCDTLTGPFGAYNLFESELRANIIIMQLDKIQQNQRMIYSAILELTAVIDSIGYEIGALRNDIASSEGRILGGINELNNSIKTYGI